MPIKKPINPSNVDFFKCFVIDNSLLNITENIVGIKKLLYHTLLSENYIKHKTRAKINNFISIFLSNVETDEFLLGYKSNHYRSIDLLYEENKDNGDYVNSDDLFLKHLQDSKPKALLMLKNIYQKLEAYKELFINDDFVDDDEILSALLYNLKHLADVYNKYPNQKAANQFYIILKNHQAFENVKEEDLEKCISQFKDILNFFSKNTSNSNGNLRIKFNFLVCDEENNLEGFFESKLKWFCSQFDELSAEFEFVETNITTLKKTLKYFEFEDYLTVDPRVVFQGDLIFNSQFLNKNDSNYKKNSIPIVGYPAIKKTSAKSKKNMQVLEREDNPSIVSFNKLKYETYKTYKDNDSTEDNDVDFYNSIFSNEEYDNGNTQNMDKSLNIPDDRISKAYKIGDSYQVLTYEQEKKLISLQIPYEQHLLEEFSDGDENYNDPSQYKNALYNKSIIPLYTIPRDNMPVDYLTGESQMIVCDLYSSKTHVSKADYLSFIAFVDVLNEENLISVGRYLKKDTNYDLSLCCLAPFLGFIGNKEYKALIITKLSYGLENRNIFDNSISSNIAKKINKEKNDDSNSLETDSNLKTLISDFVGSNILSLGSYTENVEGFFAKDKGLPKQSNSYNKTDQIFPCTNIASNLMEEKLNNLTIDSLHGKYSDAFEKELENKIKSQEDKSIDSISSKSENDLKNKFYLKKVYNTQTLRKQYIKGKQDYIPNKVLKLMLQNLGNKYDIKLNNDYIKEKTTSIKKR